MEYNNAFIEDHSSKDINYWVLVEQNVNEDTENHKGFMTAILCNNGQSIKIKQTPTVASG